MQSRKSLLKGSDNELNQLTMSDEQILQQIYTTHVHSDTKFDVSSLFTLVDNIVTRSTNIVDTVVLGSQGSPASQEHIDDKMPLANFSLPLCTLKSISSEMSCKPPGAEIAHKTTLAILNKLSHYSWDAKAVLTLAALAIEYGEFWLLYQLQPANLLAKSLAVLKSVPVLTKPAVLPKHRQAIAEFNNLIKTTLQVIEVIFELEKLNFKYDTKKVPALAPALQQIPIYVYWAIVTVVAIVTQIDCLTTDSVHRQELSHYGQKINIILSKLRKQITLCEQQKEEAEYFANMHSLLSRPTEIMEVMKLLIFPVKDVPQQLFHGATRTMVNIDVLRQKNIFLFISTLDITEEDISVLRSVYDHVKKDKKKDNEYKIVWIPIVEEWNENLKKKFEIQKTKMPWFVVHQFAFTVGHKFIKEEWHFKKKPMVLTMNVQAEVKHRDAFHMIKVYGIKGFPFTEEIERKLHSETYWLEHAMGSIHSGVATWMQEERHIFFYGGNDKEWIQNFTKYATALANDPVIKDAKISIELFCVEKEDRSLISKFWGNIESLFVTKVQKEVDSVTLEVQKMLSYKNETGWALLSKGSAVKLSGHGTTILKAVAEFEKWRELVAKKGFEITFKEYHQRIDSTIHRCSHVEIPNVTGKLPESIRCPECPSPMEIYIHYKCCHNEHRTANVGH